jgi:hypothetical protein
MPVSGLTAGEFVEANKRHVMSRPEFMRERFTHEGSYPYMALLAKVGDDGALEVLKPIYADETKDFAAWVLKVWA